MSALVIGASAGVGRALCEALAGRGTSLVIAASDLRDLNALAAHLRLVYEVDVRVVCADVTDIKSYLALIATANDDLDDIDSLFFPIGFSRNDDAGLLTSDHYATILNANLVVIIETVSFFLPALMRRPHARIVAFSSVAAIRGRKDNMVYSASKRALESYFESLRHLLSSTDVLVQIYRLGYISTQQSFGKKLIFPAASPESITKRILMDSGRDFGIRHFPRYWTFIGFAVRSLPWFIFKKLNF